MKKVFEYNDIFCLAVLGLIFCFIMGYLDYHNNKKQAKDLTDTIVEQIELTLKKEGC